MIFAIKLPPECEDVFKQLYLSDADIIAVLRKHAMNYLGDVDGITFSYIPPSKLDKLDPLGQRGYLVWTDEYKTGFGHYHKVLEGLFPVFNSSTYKKAMVFADPPELRDSFDFDALGIADYMI